MFEELGALMRIAFEERCKALGNPDFMTSQSFADIVLSCWKLPSSIFVHEIVVLPTRSAV
jgi:hypothetical protein